MNATGHDPRWWVTITTTEGKVKRYPFAEKANALKFMVDCRDQGCLAEMQPPRDPQHPWRFLS